MMKRISELALQLMMSATLPACLFCFAAFLPFAAAQSGTAGTKRDLHKPFELFWYRSFWLLCLHQYDGLRLSR